MSESRQKTIVFFNSNKAWGGGEKWHLTACKEFQRQGLNCILIANENSEIAKKGIEEGQNVYRFKVSNLSFLNPIKIFVFYFFFKSKNVDAVIMNLPADLKIAGIAAKLAGVPKIIYRRGMPHSLKNNILNRFLFTKILTHVVVNSKEVGRSLKEGNESWFPQEKIVLVYNGVDTSKPIEKNRKLYEKQNNELVIGNAGRLTEQKGQKYLIELAKLLKANGINFKILIAGEGELKSSLQELINKSGLQNEVKLLGHVSDMPGFLNSLDVFVFTSLYEGMANTLIETLQYGVPTIAWNVSSMPEIIEDKVTGFLVKPFEVEGIYQVILEIVGNPQFIEKIRVQGEERVRQVFETKTNLKIIKNLI